MAREVQPGTSHEDEQRPRIVLPAQILPEVAPVQEERPRPEELDVPEQGRGHDSSAVRANDANERAQWQKDLAARYREML